VAATPGDAVAGVVDDHHVVGAPGLVGQPAAERAAELLAGRVIAKLGKDLSVAQPPAEQVGQPLQITRHRGKPVLLGQVVVAARACPDEEPALAVWIHGVRLHRRLGALSRRARRRWPVRSL
jgi:hypothetical protein